MEEFEELRASLEKLWPGENPPLPAMPSSYALFGQSTSAVHINLGVARKVPEVNKGLTVTAGVGSSFFEKIGPAPVSMPNNNFLGANPLYTRRATSATVGLTWTF